ncbi:MAG TPA: hypothetical protein DHV28_07435 [Ignavibacteriales bacterium]|nr:hypothetical protein [Ignavibacteriales bacterium]
MTRIIIESQNKSDVLQITELADRLKIKYKIEMLSSNEEREKLNIKSIYSLLDKGADISNYGDPSEWQRTVRKDRRLNPS